MKIIFFKRDTGEIIDNSYDMLFIRGDGSVWCDNGETWESQYSVIGFDDCIIPCPELSWKINEDT